MTPTTSSTATATQSARPRRGRRILRRIGLGILGLIGVLISCAVIGIVYEAIMAAGDAQRYPPPGQLVDVGGYQLELNCTGGGSPTVILTYGFADNSLTWNAVQKQIAAEGQVRVCAWDRAGLGWSEALPQQRARTPSDVAAELHTLLTKADIPGPYVMVGHSLGDKPLALLVSTQGIKNNDRWQKAQEMMATYSSNSRTQIVSDSEHMLQWQYPAAVTATVVDVIESVRTSQPLASR